MIMMKQESGEGEEVKRNVKNEGNSVGGMEEELNLN